MTTTTTARKNDKNLRDALLAASLRQGYDPEMLYVECALCGSPVLLEPGRATDIIKDACVDPMELDSSCMLVTRGCPRCSHELEHEIRLCRLSLLPEVLFPPMQGHA